MINPMSLEGKRILVTGASSGIGRACAVCAAKLGANVILTARRAAALEETRLQMDRPDSHVCIPFDMSDANGIDGFALKAIEGGKLNGFVHAAGIGPMMPLGLESYPHLEQVFRTNCASFSLLMKSISKVKFRAERFSAVAVSSVAALSGWGGVVAYAGSKGALSAVVRACAMELAPKGVRVNAVCPSNIKTPMYEAGSVEMNDPDALRRLLGKQPLGLGEPDQVAMAVCFLLSDASSFITGVNLPVDGGYMAQ